MTTAELSEYLTTDEAAALLRRAPETLRYWRHRSEGPASFKIGRRVLYSRADVVAFIELHREASTRRPL
jgi:Helix-turn-helix domain